jgi:hypothetical protein
MEEKNLSRSQNLHKNQKEIKVDFQKEIEKRKKKLN